MPRPPTKRNRTKPPAASKKNAQPQAGGTGDANTVDTAKSPSTEKQDAGNASRGSRAMADSTASEARRQLRSQTPLSKSHEQAIESSPMGERMRSGSRPPSRARGYSSTLSLAGRKGDMSSKIPGTPGFESSILSNFRRRPRQPSILQMMQAEDDGSSDLDDDDFLGGLSPEDESTPLNLSRGKSLLMRPASTPSEAPSPSGSNKRKRAAEELQVPQSPLGLVKSTPMDSQVPENDQDNENNEDDETASAPADAPSPSQVPEDNQDDNPAASVEEPSPSKSLEAFSQTIAPPMSSSLPGSPAHGASAPVYDDPPSTTAERTRKAFREAPDNAAHLTTAILQDRLLPRRRQRRHRNRNGDGYDVPSDESDDEHPAAEHDEDELSYLPARKTSRNQRKPSDKLKPVPNSRAKQKSKPGENGKKGTTKEKSTKPAAKTSKQTHTRLQVETNFDKENQPADMSSPLSSPLDSDAFQSDASSSESQPTENFLSEELRKQKMKFEEVDKWEMDFEEVVGAESQESCR